MINQDRFPELRLKMKASGQNGLPGRKDGNCVGRGKKKDFRTGVIKWQIFWII